MFGDLADDAGFVERLEETLTGLHTQGVRATLAAHVDAAGPVPALTETVEESQPA